MADALERAATDPRVRVVRLGGAGRGFSSGAGISADDQPATGTDPTETLIAGQPRGAGDRRTAPARWSPSCRGPTAGVGVSLALACDLVLASEKAFFLLAFTKIGLMPDGGASALVAAAIGRIRAMRMALLAERISAAEALRPRAWSARSTRPTTSRPRSAKVIERLVAGPGGGATQDQAGHQRARR